MNSEIKYIELKSGYSHNGPAWIGFVNFSKSKQTIYFNGKAFKKIGASKILGNYYDLQTMEKYWISGVKKDMTDRYKSSTGEMFIEKKAIEEYLKVIQKGNLAKHFTICKVIESPSIDETYELENEKLNFLNQSIHVNNRLKKPNEMTDEELGYFIDYFEEESIRLPFLKGRKFARNKVKELELEKLKRNKKVIPTI
ncbi:hypothetical protein [Apibacter sp. HY039]|uniref:hypothetical protein n=1 Tax=Apibacter sp. HY039 TaxID=2501476 RepID=UPI000FEBA20C|nr:hypothetical protein [Apibacter sp. HY039]